MMTLRRMCSGRLKRQFWKFIKERCLLYNRNSTPDIFLDIFEVVFSLLGFHFRRNNIFVIFFKSRTAAREIS